jgi:hypothetical protein
MSALEITATDGLIVVSRYQALLRIEGELELLRSIARTVEKMLEGAFGRAHFEPCEYQGLARSSLSLEIAVE